MEERRTCGRLSPGDQIGDLTILYDTGERKGNCIVWHCRCRCGNEADFVSGDFNRRGITDCGCRTKIRHRREKIKPGDRFGDLTVLADSGKRKYKEIIWLCRCRCGNEILVNTVALHGGKVSDCGCVSSLKSNLLGRRFGNLTVIGDEGTQSRDHVWRCRCSCGGECLATTSHLTHGEVKSCGCLHDTIGRKNLRLVDGTSVTKLEARCADSEKLTVTNTSGYNGVYPQSSHGRRTGRWVAQIGFKNKKYRLGTFDRAEDAARARKLAEEKLYGGFLTWYYEEYLPGQRTAHKESGMQTAKPEEMRVEEKRGRQRTAADEPYRTDRNYLRAAAE